MKWHARNDARATGSVVSAISQTFRGTKANCTVNPCHLLLLRSFFWAKYRTVFLYKVIYIYVSQSNPFWRCPFEKHTHIVRGGKIATSSYGEQSENFVRVIQKRLSGSVRDFSMNLRAWFVGANTSASHGEKLLQGSVPEGERVVPCLIFMWLEFRYIPFLTRRLLKAKATRENNAPPYDFFGCTMFRANNKRVLFSSTGKFDLPMSNLLGSLLCFPAFLIVFFSFHPV